jgi:hypothetical protein
MRPKKSGRRDANRRNSSDGPAMKLSIDAIILGAYRKFARGKYARNAMRLCFGSDGTWVGEV